MTIFSFSSVTLALFTLISYPTATLSILNPSPTVPHSVQMHTGWQTDSFPSLCWNALKSRDGEWSCGSQSSHWIWLHCSAHVQSQARTCGTCRRTRTCQIPIHLLGRCMRERTVGPEQMPPLSPHSDPGHGSSVGGHGSSGPGAAKKNSCLWEAHKRLSRSHSVYLRGQGSKLGIYVQRLHVKQ